MDGQDAERSEKSLRWKAWRGYRSLRPLSMEIVSEGWRILLCGAEWEDDQ